MCVRHRNGDRPSPATRQGRVPSREPVVESSAERQSHALAPAGVIERHHRYRSSGGAQSRTRTGQGCVSVTQRCRCPRGREREQRRPARVSERHSMVIGAATARLGGRPGPCPSTGVRASPLHRHPGRAVRRPPLPVLGSERPLHPPDHQGCASVTSCAGREADGETRSKADQGCSTVTTGVYYRGRRAALWRGYRGVRASPLDVGTSKGSPEPITVCVRHSRFTTMRADARSGDPS